MTLLSSQLPAPPSAQVAIAIGSNLNRPPQQIAHALASLAAHPQISLLKVSRWYWTVPQLPDRDETPQPPYLNGAALLATDLDPRALMHTLLAIEAQQGRVRTARWQARPLDLDIILWQEQVIDDPLVTVPHPRAWERDFVMVPLAEIIPTWRHPHYPTIAIAERAQQFAPHFTQPATLPSITVC